jgi:eukaryotic-like serine/threonine-protein kinase
MPRQAARGLPGKGVSSVVKEAREFTVLGPLMGGFGSQAFLGAVHDQGPAGLVLKPAVFVFIPDEILQDPDSFKKLWAETERAGEIDHVNVIGVMGVARLAEGYARVVEYADAESLRSVYRRAQTMKSPMPASVAIALIADACMGVHYAHELGEAETGTPWVHGGVRPETLQISFAGMAKVTGYGAQILADTFRKKGATGLITRDTYTAPEQAIGGRHSATVQSDIYALGCILYEALTGKPPFSGDKDLAEAMIKDELSRPSLVGVTEAMADVVLKATKKKASERYATALDMRMDLFERCEPANESEVRRYLDELFPPNAIPRATRIQMLRKAQLEKPAATGRLLVEPPAELTLEHAERAAIPDDAEIEARTGQTVDDLPLADADALDAEPVVAATAAALVQKTLQWPPPPPTGPGFAVAPTTTPGGMTPQPPPSWHAPVTAPPQAAAPAPAPSIQQQVLPAPPPSSPSLASAPAAAIAAHRSPADELTDPVQRKRTQAPLPPLPPVQPAPPPPPSKTPVGLIVAVSVLGTLVLVLGGYVVLQQTKTPLPAPPPVVVVAPPPPAPPPPAPAPVTEPPPAPAPAPAPTGTGKTGTTAAKPPATGPGTLVIHSTPSMMITVDGKDAGEGSVTMEVPPGKHTIVGKADGTTVKRLVTMKPGGKETVNLRIEKGALAIEAPPGCDVIIDGKKVGKTPMDSIELTAGTHNVVVRQNGIDFKKAVPIKAGLEMVLTVTFHQ